MKFTDLYNLDKPLSFYGVHSHKFKLGDVVFEAIEDPDDGYRSYLESVVLSKPTGIFSKQPLTQVYVFPSNYDGDDYDEGNSFDLIDANTGHVWLSCYTEHTDDYYPMFCFNYTPDENKTTYSNNYCPKQLYPELFI